MVTLSRKNKIIISTIILISAILAIALPLASAQATSNAVSNVKTLKAQGNVYQTIDSNTIKYYPASLTLALQPTSTNGPVKKFDVTGGTLNANGITYTFTNGNGAILKGRHVILMQAQGTSPGGQTVTLKLVGKYSWLGGTTLRIGAKLQTQDATYTLQMRAPI